MNERIREDMVEEEEGAEMKANMLKQYSGFFFPVLGLKWLKGFTH